MNKEIIIDEALAIKVKDVVSKGLCKGLGNPIPGQLCVEAAVNYACGLPHGDNPSCVGSAVRSFKIRLNDARWSSNQARAEGMKKIAIAQLGSNTINQREFANIVAFKTITVLMPVFLEDRGYKEEAVLCKNSKDLQEARSNMLKVRDALRKIAYAAATYAAYAAAATYATYATYAAYAAAATYATYAADAAYADATYAAYAAATYAAYAAAATYATYAADAADADKYLVISSNICLEALIELKSPGVQFLYLYN